MLKDKLLGTWRLVRAFETRDGRVVDPAPLGQSPTGFIHYMADGRMSALIAHHGRVPMSNGSRRQAPEPELAQAARSFDAYAGPFTVRDAHTVVHHLEVSFFQDDVGKDYVRSVEFVDGELHLGTPEFRVTDGVRGMKLVWQKLNGV